MLDRIDHLVFAASDLEAGVRHLEDLTGVRAQFGGAVAAVIFRRKRVRPASSPSSTSTLEF